MKRCERPLGVRKRSVSKTPPTPLFFGTRYLLKRGGMEYGRISAGEELVALFQEFCERGLRVAFDNQAFLFRPTFTFCAFHLGFFSHLSLISHKFLAGVNKVPQPGIEPGRPNWARDCKSRLYANSSTGAQDVPDMGMVTPCQVSPIPTFFGRSSAALQPS